MKSRKPNILWLMTDEQRTDSLGCYGSPWAQSPYLDQFAKEGVFFKNAITPSPVCMPARASLLTGLYPSTTGIWDNSDPHQSSFEPLTYYFERAGYQTASFGKHHYGSPNKAFQYEYNRTLSDEVSYFEYAAQYDPEQYNWVKYSHERAVHPWVLGGQFPEFMERKTEAQCIDKAMEWFEERSTDDPFFLRISFNAPHTPVVPPYPFDSIIRKEDVQYPLQVEGAGDDQPEWVSKTLKQFCDPSYLSDDEIKEARRYYYGETAFLDYQMGRLLDWMSKNGLLENTIIAFVSDHGTHIGDHDLLQKQTFYNSVVNVPYFFWYPTKISGGVEIEIPVETRSLLPTLLELAGLYVPDPMRDVSLADVLCEGIEPQQNPVFSELSLGTFDESLDDRIVMIRDGDWKLFACFNPEMQDGALYNLAQDPYEQHNLFYKPEYQNIVKRLGPLIKQHLEKEVKSADKRESSRE